MESKVLDLKILTEDAEKELKGRFGYYDNVGDETKFQKVNHKSLKEALNWADTFIPNDGKAVYKVTKSINDNIKLNFEKLNK